MQETSRGALWPRPRPHSPKTRVREAAALGPVPAAKRARHDAATPTAGAATREVLLGILQHARRTLATDGAVAGRGTPDDPLRLREFVPEDFRPGAVGATFLARHGVAAARVADTSPASVAKLADLLDGELRARGLTRTGLAADGELRARILQRHPALPLQLRTARIGGGHARAALDPPLPLVEAGLLLDRVGQSREAWHLRGQSAPVFDALFDVHAPAPGSADPEPLMADAMPFAFAVPGRPTALVSALRPLALPPLGRDAGAKGVRFNALRPLRERGVLHLVPGTSVLFNGPTARTPETHDAVRDFLAEVSARAGGEPPAALRMTIALDPGCVYLWHPAMWAALTMDARATPATTPPFLGQFQRFQRVSEGDAEARRNRQWCFAVKVRGTNPARAVEQAGLPRRAAPPPTAGGDDGTPRPPVVPWREAEEAFSDADQRRTERLASALFAPYADPNYTFPHAPTPLTALMVGRRPYSLIGGSEVVAPLLASASTVSVLEGLLPARLRGRYEEWCAAEAVFTLQLHRQRRAEHAARERQALSDDRMLSLAGAANFEAHMFAQFRESQPDMTPTEFRDIMNGSLLSASPGYRSSLPIDPWSAQERSASEVAPSPARTADPEEAVAMAEDEDEDEERLAPPGDRIVVDLRALLDAPSGAPGGPRCALCVSDAAAAAHPHRRYWLSLPADEPRVRASRVACAPCVVARLACRGLRSMPRWWRSDGDRGW